MPEGSLSASRAAAPLVGGLVAPHPTHPPRDHRPSAPMHCLGRQSMSAAKRKTLRPIKCWQPKAVFPPRELLPPWWEGWLLPRPRRCSARHTGGGRGRPEGGARGAAEGVEQDAAAARAAHSHPRGRRVRPLLQGAAGGVHPRQVPHAGRHRGGPHRHTGGGRAGDGPPARSRRPHRGRGGRQRAAGRQHAAVPGVHPRGPSGAAGAGREGGRRLGARRHALEPV